MKNNSLILFVIAFISICISITSCNETHPDFEEIDHNVFKKLIAFGDTGITVSEGKFVHLSIVIEEDTNERVITSIIPASALSSIITNQKLLADINDRNTGDIIKYIAPSNVFVFTKLTGNDSLQSLTESKSEIEVLFEIHSIEENSDSLRNYLQTCAQTGAMEETEAIRNWQVTCECDVWKEVNDLSFAYFNQTEGDSIKSGKEVLIRYNTHLLNGLKLDSITEMKFTFGKPGQLIQGFQWGLAKLKEGEHAYIFMPSIWAFGEDGIPDGPVPPRTPVYIDVEVVEVH